MCLPPPPAPPRADLRPHPRTGHTAFTLLEIMLVVAIIALLLAAGFNQMGNVIYNAQEVRAKSDVATFSQKLKMYEAWSGSLPTTEQGLQSLSVQPQSEPRPAKWYQYMEKIPKDPWNEEYIYVQPGVHNPQGFDVYSKGKDHQAGTADDIGNWE